MTEQTRTESTASGVAEWMDSTPARVTGAGAAMAATWLTARDAVRRAFFKSMNKPGADTFLDLQERRDKLIGAVVEPAKRGLPVPDAMARVKAINTEYDRRWAERMQLLGVHGMRDEMKALKRHQWMEVVMTTGAVAAVAVGAVLAIASNRDIARKQEEIEQDVKRNGI